MHRCRSFSLGFFGGSGEGSIFALEGGVTTWLLAQPKFQYLEARAKATPLLEKPLRHPSEIQQDIQTKNPGNCRKQSGFPWFHLLQYRNLS